MLLEVFPEMIIVGNKKTAGFLESFFGITGNVKIVEDGDTLDLGDRKLKFYLTPMVHWPETMMTYEDKDRMLFSGDAFGGFGTLTCGIFDDEVDLQYFEDEILRYFSNIVGKYSPMVQKAIAKLRGVELGVICPTHGPIWRKNPSWIVGRYDRWSRYEAEEGIVIAYASMYGNTESMMEAVARGLAIKDFSKIRVHDVSKTHVSFLIRDAWRFKALILGSPTYDTKLFPLMDNFIRLLEHKQLKNRILGLFGTYGWSGGGVSGLEGWAEKIGWELVYPVIEACCSPKDDDLGRCMELGKNVVAKLEFLHSGIEIPSTTTIGLVRCRRCEGYRYLRTRCRCAKYLGSIAAAFPHGAYVRSLRNRHLKYVGAAAFTGKFVGIV
jgi:flavorubredoxin